jgi:hypothetical protein
MARLPRMVLLGIPHHVTQRVNRRERTFFEDGDYALYLDLLAEAPRCATGSKSSPMDIRLVLRVGHSSTGIGIEGWRRWRGRRQRSLSANGRQGRHFPAATHRPCYLPNDHRSPEQDEHAQHDPHRLSGWGLAIQHGKSQPNYCNHCHSRPDAALQNTLDPLHRRKQRASRLRDRVDCNRQFPIFQDIKDRRNCN